MALKLQALQFQRAARGSRTPKPIIVSLPEGSSRDSSPNISPTSASPSYNGRDAVHQSSWSRKVQESDNKTPGGARQVRKDDDALGYTAMTSTSRSLRSPGDDGQSPSVWHVGMAACGILTLVLVAICCGAWLGVQLGTRAMTGASKSGESNAASHHPASIVHAKDADLIQANWSAVPGATAAQQQRLGQNPPLGFLDKPDTVSETTSRPLAAIVMDRTTTSTMTGTKTTTSMASTSTQTSSTSSSSSSSSSSTSTTPPSSTLRLPSLFCFSIMRCDSYELSLVRTQMAKGLGIFGCDAYSVFSDAKTWLTPGPPIRIDSTVLGISLEAKAGTKEHILNTEIFLKAWEQVKADGLYIEHDWIVKVDPDAVFFPERLRDRLVRITPAGASIYFRNCRLSFGLFGALEVMSRLALLSFYDGLERCKQVLPWQSFGEDMFLRKCLDFLRVSPHTDFSLLSDGYCGEQPSPCVSGKVAFHPFKNVETYMRCAQEASR